MNSDEIEVECAGATFVMHREPRDKNGKTAIQRIVESWENDAKRTSSEKDDSKRSNTENSKNPEDQGKICK